MKKQYLVNLTADQRAGLKAMLRKGVAPARTLTHPASCCAPRKAARTTPSPLASISIRAPSSARDGVLPMSPDQVRTVVEKPLRETSAEATHWSTRTMARAVWAGLRARQRINALSEGLSTQWI